MSSRGSTFAALGAASALLMVTACATTTSSDTASSPGSAVPAAATTTDPDVGAPPGAEILGRPAVGEPFRLTIDYSDTSALDEFEVTVEDVTCGEPLDPKALAHAADPGTEPPPEEGKQYCVVSMEVLNVGKREADWSADDAVTVNVDDTAYSPTESDNELAGLYAQYWSDQGKTDPSRGINPGSKGPEHGIFQIPVGDEPTTVWVASGNLLQTINGVEPGYLVQLRNTTQS
ncbi:DUF4352 domain-containing protein [Streptomyces sp. CAI 127]|uniref:DUF4352 domain-containing protein n=1 Tax=Streptomyces sp. CAI 127 TaxID=1076397 RepID=UPI0015873F69|nr:DUF4352 domain-containing protein [Streptomyces sp. CAI 127]NUW04543.1 DUF4352 domain-containing protein [Streptomyces sp. CAI 127]